MTRAASVSQDLYAGVHRAAAVLGCAPAATEAPGRNARIPLAALTRYLAELGRRSGDPDLGLRLGVLVDPRCFAIAGPTLLEALPSVARFQRPVAGAVGIDMTLDARTLCLEWRFPDAQPTRELVDLFMTGVRSFGAWLLGCRPRLIEAHFGYDAPPSTARHEEIFGDALAFGTKTNGFSLERASLGIATRAVDPACVPLRTQAAAEILTACRGDSRLAAISRALLELMPEGRMDVAAVAARFGQSPRSLQRALRNRGTHFNRLRQQLRQQLAHEYLAVTELPLQDIAGRLGYEDQSAFCHAYRQWTGHAPGVARRDMGRRVHRA